MDSVEGKSHHATASVLSTKHATDIASFSSTFFQIMALCAEKADFIVALVSVRNDHSHGCQKRITPFAHTGGHGANERAEQNYDTLEAAQVKDGDGKAARCES